MITFAIYFLTVTSDDDVNFPALGQRKDYLKKKKNHIFPN